MALVPSIRQAIWTVDDDQAIGAPIALQALIDRTLEPRRVMSELLGSFSVAALVLAALGIYGVVGYRVAQRRKEIALRIALGAPGWRVTSAVVRDAAMSVGVGLVIGIPLAFGAGNAVRSYLFAVAPRDAVTIAAASLVVLATAILAAYLPARRAPKVDAMLALRAE
jgi:ABC-type antimicrobial peptide transport system permease subunit